MKNLSLKLDTHIYEETEKIITKLKKSRNRYINDALAFYNSLQKRKALAKQLHKESKMVRDESLKVLAEFENMDNED